MGKAGRRNWRDERVYSFVVEVLDRARESRDRSVSALRISTSVCKVRACVRDGQVRSRWRNCRFD